MMFCYCKSKGETGFAVFGIEKANRPHRYANRSARFILAYAQGLTGAEVAWANRKYHKHRTLPPHMITAVKNSLKA
jgi:hypothetical protein